MLRDGELEAARTILRQTDVLYLLKDVDSDRYLRLENLMSEAANNCQPCTGPSRSRNDLAELIRSKLTVVPPSRLLTLLGRALKWEEEREGLPDDCSYDVFLGTVPTLAQSADVVPSVPFRKLTLPSNAPRPECAAFSGDGQNFVFGMSDGALLVWNWAIGRLRTDLSYQQPGDDSAAFKAISTMKMSGSALCIAFSKSDADLFVCGTSNGELGMWRVSTGKSARRFPKTHAGAVASLCLSADNQSILSGGHDSVARISGIKSGRVLKEFRGHTGFIFDAAFYCSATADDSVVTMSSDGEVRFWDVKSTSCIRTMHPMPESRLSLHVLAISNSTVLVGGSSSRVFSVTPSGASTLLFDTGINDTNIIAIGFSPHQAFIYVLLENGTFFAVERKSCSIAKRFTVSDAETVNAAWHPTLNAMVTFDTHGTVTCWK